MHFKYNLFIYFSTCFFTLEDANSRQRFLKAINCTEGAGGYMCQLHAVSLNRYLMELTDEFTRERRESHRWKFAAECQGLNDDIWVLNENVQVDQCGNLLAEWSTKFVWLGRLVSRECVVPHKLAAEIATPLGATGLVNILDSLRMSSGKL